MNKNSLCAPLHVCLVWRLFKSLCKPSKLILVHPPREKIAHFTSNMLCTCLFVCYFGHMHNYTYLSTTTQRDIKIHLTSKPLHGSVKHYKKT
jgi:hypothetical protein